MRTSSCAVEQSVVKVRAGVGCRESCGCRGVRARSQRVEVVGSGWRATQDQCDYME